MACRSSTGLASELGVLRGAGVRRGCGCRGRGEPRESRQGSREAGEPGASLVKPAGTTLLQLR